MTSAHNAFPCDSGSAVAQRLLTLCCSDQVASLFGVTLGFFATLAFRLMDPDVGVVLRSTTRTRSRGNIPRGMNRVWPEQLDYSRDALLVGRRHYD